MGTMLKVYYVKFWLIILKHNVINTIEIIFWDKKRKEHDSEITIVTQ